MGIKRKTVSVHTALPQGKRDCCAVGENHDSKELKNSSKIYTKVVHLLEGKQKILAPVTK